MKGQLIALCGNPLCGKSTVANIMEEQYGAVIIDDGMILRKAVPVLFYGVEFQDLLTQEGKRKTYEVLGKTYTYRQLLGELGNLLEDFFGQAFIPEQTLRRLPLFADAPYYVLPSVRKEQPWYYKNNGAAIFQIDRDLAPPSPNAFDSWAERAVDKVITNNGTLEELEQAVRRTMFETFRDPGFTRLKIAS